MEKARGQRWESGGDDGTREPRELENAAPVVPDGFLLSSPVLLCFLH